MRIGTVDGMTVLAKALEARQRGPSCGGQAGGDRRKGLRKRAQRAESSQRRGRMKSRGMAAFDGKSPPLESKGGAPSSSLGGGVTKIPQDSGTDSVPGATFVMVKSSQEGG